MKKFLTLTLAFLMLLSFVACSADNNAVPPSDTDESSKTTEENPGITDDTEETKQELEQNYPDNILMDPYGSGGYVFFNLDVDSEDIVTVTFLDTLADMPADAWDVSAEKNGSVMAWVTDGVNLYIAGKGGVTADTCNQLFGGYYNLKSVDFGGCFYTDLTDRTTAMFRYCKNLETLDLSGWNTSNVRYMKDMFYGCNNLKSINMSGWDTSNVETMRCMFQNCFSLEAAVISHFDTSKVADFSNMFYYCKNLKSVNFIGLNTSAAESMAEMFKGCVALTTIGDIAIPDGCDTTDMFSGTPLE